MSSFLPDLPQSLVSWICRSTRAACLLISAAAFAQTDWQFIGPQPAGPLVTAISGRVTALAIDPRDENVLYLGSAGGGVWKTTNGGTDWQPLTDHLPSLAIGSLAIDPSNPDVIYAGTGETNACETCYTGAGILKSTNAGLTWAYLPGPFVDSAGRGARISSIAVHPSNSNILLAGVYFVGANGLPGIYRSNDGGTSWTAVLKDQQGTSVLFDPSAPDTAYAAQFGFGVYKSTDAGLTWTPSNGRDESSIPVENTGPFKLVLAQSEPGTLFASVVTFNYLGTSATLYKSTDGAGSWQALPTTPDFCSPQCLYANVVAVDPTNPDILFAGGSDLYRSTDGGGSWTALKRGTGSVFVRGYLHALALSTGSGLYLGADGGVYNTTDRSSSLLTWANLNDQLGITQFRAGVSIHPVRPDIGFAGAQGAGAQHYTGSVLWDVTACQDGGVTIIDSSDPSTIYASCQGTEIRKSLNAGRSWLLANNGINFADHTQAVPPFVADPSNPKRLFFGTERVYRSVDGAGSWSPISENLAKNGATITSLAVSASDPNTIYAGTSDGNVYVTQNAGDPTLAFWAKLSTGLPSRAISSIAIDTADPLSATVATLDYSIDSDKLGHVFRTTNSGVTWKDISGNLPNFPVYTILPDLDQPGTLYAGTFRGAYLTKDNGVTWSRFGSTLPEVPVPGLALHRPSRILRAATLGRGAWDIAVPLPDGSAGVPALLSVSPDSADPSKPYPLVITIRGAGFLDGTVVHWNGQERETKVLGEGTLQATVLASDLAAIGLVSIRVRNSPSGAFSNALQFTVAGVPNLDVGSFADSASFILRPVAVGSLATIFGANLALREDAASVAPFPISLSGTVVRLAGRAVPLLSVSPRQIRFQVPWELAGQDSALLQVSVGSLKSTLQTVLIGEHSPGIFTLNQSGTGQGAIVIESGITIAAPVGTLDASRPARRGEAVSIFCTGLGQVTAQPATGTATPASPISEAVTQVTVEIGGISTTAAFSGLSPGLTGIYQVNVRIPENAPSGDAIPLVISAGGVKSNSVTIAIGE
jgi:uncharacterized protein (TIGR03437 family)